MYYPLLMNMLNNAYHLFSQHAARFKIKLSITLIQEFFQIRTEQVHDHYRHYMEFIDGAVLIGAYRVDMGNSGFTSHCVHNFAFPEQHRIFCIP